MIEEILAYNKNFVATKKYESYITNKFPNKKIVILTCMDARLIELLPDALGLKNGDAKIIKNAGGVIDHPYGNVIKSLLISILELEVEKIMVIGHTDCGVQGMDGEEMLNKLILRGISKEYIETIKNKEIQMKEWLRGFSSVYESVFETVECLKSHPLIPKDINIYGFVMDSVTGELRPI